MIENSAITCSFGARPRDRSADSPVNMFGLPAAIAPHLGALPLPERKAAVMLMRERGKSDPEIAAATGLDLASVAALAELRCRPLRAFIEADTPGGGGGRPSGPGLCRRRLSVSAIERAADEALLAIDALRAQAGVARDGTFDMTLEDLGQACGFGIETARRRLKHLEARKWVRRQLRPGLPTLVRVALAGRCRLEALGRIDAPATGEAGKRLAP
jgi:hypothetical protein